MAKVKSITPATPHADKRREKPGVYTNIRVEKAHADKRRGKAGVSRVVEKYKKTLISFLIAILKNEPQASRIGAFCPSCPFYTTISPLPAGHLTHCNLHTGISKEEEKEIALSSLRSLLSEEDYNTLILKEFLR